MYKNNCDPQAPADPVQEECRCRCSVAALGMGCRTSVMTLSRRRLTSTSSHRKFCRFCGGGGCKLLTRSAEP
jgi:hypothetical protein